MHHSKYRSKLNRIVNSIFNDYRLPPQNGRIARPEPITDTQQEHPYDTLRRLASIGDKVTKPRRTVPNSHVISDLTRTKTKHQHQSRSKRLDYHVRS